MRSALYEGEVVHRRLAPRPHAFRYALTLAYLDLDELPDALEGTWLASARRPAPLSFRRGDYLRDAAGGTDRPLKEVVLERVAERLGRRPAGPVSVLTQLRTLGYLFNPVSFYYCHAADGRLDAVLADITNTPWGERHAYVLDARGHERGSRLAWRFAKDFHVSPFFEMELDYDWRFSTPAERLDVGMTSLRAGEPVFHATLACRRRELSRANLARALVRRPCQTARVHAAIYWQAALLWLRRTPFHAHPAKRAARKAAAR
jgi:DUF1365 family protein